MQVYFKRHHEKRWYYSSELKFWGRDFQTWLKLGFILRNKREEFKLGDH